jgi:hypothetical protein
VQKKLQVNFLLFIGMRLNIEAMNIQWRSCRWYEVGGVKYVRICVKGEAGARYLMAKHECIDVLKRFHGRRDEIKSKK